MAPRRPYSQNQANNSPICDIAGCEAAGLYRAPKSPQLLRDYYWFCLEHVQIYNKNWNFCSHMTSAELEVFMTESLIGGQPTRPFGIRNTSNPRWRWQQMTQNLREKMHYAFHDQPEQFEKKENDSYQTNHYLTNEQAKAFSLFSLTAAANFGAVQNRYRLLAKKYHPDHQGGDRRAEQKLKEINLAYAVLKKFYLSRQPA